MRSIIRDLLPPIMVRATRRLFGRARSPARPIETVMPSFSSPKAGSFSQYGEDLVLDAVLGCSSKGFFIDIGANDPALFNNTKRFSLRGWTGINVEPNPSVFARIVQDRPNDLNLNLGVGLSDSIMTFYNIEPDTLSTFSKLNAEHSIEIYKGAGSSTPLMYRLLSYGL